MIRPMTANTTNQKPNITIKIKRIGIAQNRTRQNRRRLTLICPTKVIIKVRDAIKRGNFGKRNGTLSNYA